MTVALEVAGRYRDGATIPALMRDYGLSRRQVRGILDAFVGEWRHWYQVEAPRCRACEIILGRCPAWARAGERDGLCGYCAAQGLDERVSA